MLRRTMDATLLNEVANLPEVRPFLGGEGTLDLSDVVTNPANYALVGERGGFVLHPILAGVYELHTVFAPDGRGKAFFAAAREMFRYMFTQTDALEIVTKCPDDNGGARMAAATVGFRERFRREGAWAPGVGVSYQVFSVDDWCARDDAALQEGQAFHAMLETAKAEAGSELQTHAEDVAHDRTVGAAMLMARAGNLDKGVAFYNRWAAFAGYAMVSQVGRSAVDIQDAIIAIQHGEPGILLLR